MVTAITNLAEFNEIINGDKPVVIDFWATWCGPCTQIRPKFEALSTEDAHSGIGFYKVDVDEAADITTHCNVRAMPTFQVYHKGEKVDQVVGADQKNLQTLVAKAAALI